jgi:hypothetical protein
MLVSQLMTLISKEEFAEAFPNLSKIDKQWEVYKPDDPTAKELILKCLPIAWKMANECNKEEALGCIVALHALTWWLGDAARFDFGFPLYFGKLLFKEIGDYYGFNSEEHDDGTRRN